MDTIAMDTYPLIASVTGAATDAITQQDPVFRRARAKATLRSQRFSSPQWSGKRRSKGPLAYKYSLRDNGLYRAALARPNRRLINLWRSSMTTAAGDQQIVPREPVILPELRAADQGVADALESVLSDNTRRVYSAQWRLFNDWCDSVDLRALPADPLTVARYLAVRANAGVSVATLRLAASAIAKAHQWAGHESPCRDQGVRASLKGWGRRLARPQRQAGALTADVLGCHTAHRRPTPPPRLRPRNGRAGR